MLSKLMNYDGIIKQEIWEYSTKNWLTLITIFPFLLVVAGTVAMVAFLAYLPIVLMLGLPYVYLDKTDLSRLPFGVEYSEIAIYFLAIGLFGSFLISFVWGLWCTNAPGDREFTKKILFKITKWLYVLGFVWIALFGAYKTFYWINNNTWDFPQKQKIEKKIVKPSGLGLKGI